MSTTETFIKFSTFKNDITIQRFGGGNSFMVMHMLDTLRDKLSQLNSAWQDNRFYSSRRRVEEMRKWRDEAVLTLLFLSHADIVSAPDMRQIFQEINEAHTAAYRRRLTYIK